MQVVVRDDRDLKKFRRVTGSATVLAQLEQYVALLADIVARKLEGYLSSGGFKPLDALVLYILGDLIRHIRRGSSRTLRIGEDVKMSEFHALDEFDRLTKQLLGLAREADDDVSRERDAGQFGASVGDVVLNLGGAVFSAHYR